MTIIEKEQRLLGGIPVLEDAVATESNSTKRTVQIHLGKMIKSTLAKQKYKFSLSELIGDVKSEIIKSLDIEEAKYSVDFDMSIDIENELLQYGLVTREVEKPMESVKIHEFIRSTRPTLFMLVFTTHKDRFLFWLKYNNQETQTASSYIAIYN